MQQLFEQGDVVTITDADGSSQQYLIMDRHPSTDLPKVTTYELLADPEWDAPRPLGSAP